MADSDEKPLRAIGAYWLEEPDYEAALRIFEDGDAMPRTWQ